MNFPANWETLSIENWESCQFWVRRNLFARLIICKGYIYVRVKSGGKYFWRGDCALKVQQFRVDTEYYEFSKLSSIACVHVTHTNTHTNTLLCSSVKQHLPYYLL